MSHGHVTSHLPIETPRLVLRDLADGDGPAVHTYAHDAAVVRYLDWGPNSAEDTPRFLAMARTARDAVPRTAYHLAIVLRSTERLIGGCRIEIRNAASGNGDIGYVLARDAWGHGYATEAARALVAFGFQALALHRIWATCDVENQPPPASSRRSACSRRGAPPERPAERVARLGPVRYPGPEGR